jgi:YggT family protein
MNYTVARLISFLFDAITLLILLDVIGSWVVALRIRLPDWGYNILKTIRGIADVLLGPIRRVIPSIGGLDISPIVALILLDILRRLIAGALLR